MDDLSNNKNEINKIRFRIHFGVYFIVSVLQMNMERKDDFHRVRAAMVQDTAKVQDQLSKTIAALNIYGMVPLVGGPHKTPSHQAGRRGSKVAQLRAQQQAWGKEVNSRHYSSSSSSSSRRRDPVDHPPPPLHASNSSSMLGGYEAARTKYAERHLGFESNALAAAHAAKATEALGLAHYGDGRRVERTAVVDNNSTAVAPGTVHHRDGTGKGGGRVHVIRHRKLSDAATSFCRTQACPSPSYSIKLNGMSVCVVWCSMVWFV
jgi:hypothetical protein